MKTTHDIKNMTARRLEAHAYDPAGAWPYDIPVGLPSRNTLEQDAVTYLTADRELRRMAEQAGCTLSVRNRMIGVPVELVERVTIPNEDTALRLTAGDERAERYLTIRHRIAQVKERFHTSFEEAATFVRTLKPSDRDDDTAFILDMDAAAYFATHDVTGMDPRQVPLAGFSGKFLDGDGNRREKAITRLIGKDTLGLRHPTGERFRFRLLDPMYASEPDLIVEGQPWDSGRDLGLETAIIIENKATYRMMPAIRKGLCIWGHGYTAANITNAIPWLDHLHVVYWGDIDADGLQILSDLRVHTGIDCESILMDMDAYNEYQHYGTTLDPFNKPIRNREPNPVPGLHPKERRLYEHLCNPRKGYPPRIEQERIPLDRAMQELTRLGIQKPLSPGSPVY
ncbi:hypothetical protein CSQ85_11930 [Bifidobacterium rousetti]|uniref:DUF3322 and DUF2220 domain-containing protein n=1 Tax=Bifidobacterium rousetti TaxID=2045439 RepID=UPI00123BEC7A|nr:DUF3322 and DUF2220 domain-containing protein [Bifidobacterium rousetti]KAA8816126.1 hypothetical protein CSQ85_11930 [Bifidobacterium rousetti]